MKVEKRKFSELMRIGIELRPQAHGDYFDDVSQGEHIVTGSCALGAVWEAATGHSEPLLAPDRNDDFRRRIARYCLKVPYLRVLDDITYKNDSDRWTREEIADWLEAQGY